MPGNKPDQRWAPAGISFAQAADEYRGEASVTGNCVGKGGGACRPETGVPVSPWEARTGQKRKTGEIEGAKGAKNEKNQNGESQANLEEM